MKKMSKVVVLLLAVLMVASLFGACGTGNNTTAPATSGTTDPNKTNAPSDDTISGTVNLLLTGWMENDNVDAQTGEQRTGFNTLLKEKFAPLFPNIKVTVSNIPWENAVPKQRTMLMSKKSDVMYVGGGAAPNFFNEGLTADLEPIVAADETYKPLEIYEENIYEATRIKSFDHKSRIALPAIGGIRMTVMDTQLFADWGQELLPNKPTVDIVLERAKAMTGKNPKTGADNYGVWFTGTSWQSYVPIMYAYDVKMIEDGTSQADYNTLKWTVNTDNFKKVFAWYKELAPYCHPGFINNQGNANKATVNNENAMYLDNNGSKEMSLWRQSGRTDTTMIDRFKPVMSLGPNGESWYPIDPIILRKGIEDANAKAAWEVMKFVAGPVTQEWNYKNYTAMPTCKPDFLEDVDVYARMNLEIMKHVHEEIYDQTCDFFITDVAPLINEFISAAANNAPMTDAQLDTKLNELQTKAEAWTTRRASGIVD